MSIDMLIDAPKPYETPTDVKMDKLEISKSTDSLNPEDKD